MTGRLIFTVDVDRDVNFEIEGKSAAGSLDRGQGTEPRFESTEKGLEIILDVLNSFNMKGTFFLEGRAASTIDCSMLKDHCVGFHGMDHEDLTKLSSEELKDVMDNGYESVKKMVKTPTCFRAPYMKTSDDVLENLRRLGIKHDSSMYADPGTAPYDIGGVTEHPVFKGKDARGKTIAAFLWPMHEGARTPSDYLSLARTSGDADLIICTHSWHMVESRERGIMTWAEMEHNRKSLGQLIKLLVDEGYEPATLTE